MIEIIAVLAVLGIVAAVVVTAITRPPMALASEADTLAAHLRYAHARALADVQPWRVRFLSATSYELGPVGAAAVRLPATDVTSRSFSGGVSVSGATEVRFDEWGRPVDTGNSPLGADRVLTLSDSSGNRTVTVTAGTGLIR